jgi:hypothetical protein
MNRYLSLLILAVGIVTCSNAAIVTTPPGLNPGDQYRLVFVTSTTTTAGSSSIAYYNNFVSALAATEPDLAVLGATWTAIGSTATNDALTNVGGPNSLIPIYRLDGLLAGDIGLVGPADIFAGANDNGHSNLLNPIDITETGSIDNTNVWTGTRANGSSDLVNGPNAFVLGGSTPVYGQSFNNVQTIFFTIDASSKSYSLYAISSTLTVPTPEPDAIYQTLLGGAFLLLAWRRKRQNDNPCGPTQDYKSFASNQAFFIDNAGDTLDFSVGGNAAPEPHHNRSVLRWGGAAAAQKEGL